MKRAQLLLRSCIGIVCCVAGYFFYLKQSGFGVQKKETPDKKIRSEILDVLQFFSEARAFPNKDIPEDGYSKAQAFHLKNFEGEAQVENAMAPWQNLGPTNRGGRTISIAIDPKDTAMVWLGSAGGGLWKSVKGGIGSNAWQYVPTGFPINGVSSIAINPANSKEMFIGTGETYNNGATGAGLVVRVTRGGFGMGILKSVDGGITWAKSLDWQYSQVRGVWDIVYNPKNSNIVYAATTEGIYKSSDSGITWNLVLDKKMVMDLAIDEVDTNIIYAGVGNLSSSEKGLYKTINSGGTWAILAGGLPSNTNRAGRISITFHYNASTQTKRLMAVVADDNSTVGVYLSTDQGATWTNRNDNNTEIVSYQGWYAKGLLMKADAPATILVGGVNAYKSTASGNALAKVSGPHADIHDIISNPKNSNKVYMITDGGLYRSNNFGASFFSCSSGLVTSQFYIGAVSSTDPKLAIGGLQDNNCYRYTGSSSWTSFLGGDGCYTAIDPKDDNIHYGSSQYLSVSKSTNRGNNFTKVLDGGSKAFLAPFIVCPSNTNVLYAGSEKLLISTDQGTTWNPSSTAAFPGGGNSVLSIAVSSTSPDTVYCTTAPSTSIARKILRSTDRGKTFSDITNEQVLPNRYPRRVVVNPKNSREVYLVFSGFGSQEHIFKSADAGASWTNISSSLPDIPFHCLAIDPANPNIIYAGSDLNVYASVNGGLSWMDYSTGLHDGTMVYDLVISPSDRTLLAFTHSNGVLQRDLMSITTGIASTKIQLKITLYPNPAKEILYIKLPLNTGEKKTEVVVYDLKGEIVYKENYEGAEDPAIGLHSLSSGAYLLKVSRGSHRFAERFIKQ